MYNVRPPASLRLLGALNDLQLAGGRGLILPDYSRIREEHRSPVFSEKLAYLGERGVEEGTSTTSRSVIGEY